MSPNSWKWGKIPSESSKNPWKWGKIPEKCTVVDLSTMKINPECNSVLEIENKKQNSFKRSSKSNSMQGFKSDLLIEYKQNLQNNEIAKSEKTALDMKIEPELCSDQNSRSNQKSSSTKGQLISK